MFLPDASIRRPVLAVMMSTALLVFGGIALVKLPVREMPRMDFPVVTVTVIYPGASPDVVEREVTDVLEEQINTVEGIRSLSSSSGEGGSQITIQFELERDVDVAAQEVRDKIAAIRRLLPSTIDEPVVAKLDLDAQAIMWIAVTAEDRDRVEITEFADKVLKPELERVEGVGQIMVGGSQEFAVRVWLDADLLAARGLTVADVSRALRTQNAEIPSGRIEGLQREFSVRTEGDLSTVEAFNDLFLAYRGGAPVYLRDVGRAEPGPRETRATARFSRLPDAVGREAVGLGVLKQTQANTVDVAHGVKARLEELRAELPPGIEATVAFDSSVYVEASVEELRETLLIGGVLAALVVLLFLASVRSSVITALSIPTSIVATFAAIYFLGFTINTLTMLALVLAVGMVIDDAVVVLESINRHRSAGKDAVAAAREGTDEIAFATVAATFSIAVVFLPLAFVKGMVGRLFLEFAVTVAVAILISLFVALTLIPMLSSRFLGVHTGEGRLARRAEAAMGRVASAYARVVRASLRVRWLVVAAGVGVLALTGVIFGSLGKELSPQVDEGSFILIMRGPQGATAAHTDRYLRQVEAVLAEAPEVSTYFAALGLSMAGPPKVTEAISFVRLRPLEERRARKLRGQHEVMADLRRRFAEIPGFLTMVLPRPTIASTSRAAPVQLVVMGPDVRELYEAGERLKREVATIPGLVDVNVNLDVNKPQLRVVPDRDRAADLGVPLTDVAETLRVLLGGEDITEFERGGERYDVMVQLAPEGRRVPEAIGGLYVRTSGGELVPLSSLVTVEETVGPSEILRYNRARSFTLEANIEGIALGEALDAVQRKAREVLPASFRTAVAGQSQDMQESFASLLFTFILAIVIIYMVLASQFNHFVHPLTIMLSLPLALFGAVGMLALLGLTVNLFSMIGMILLLGIVTRNAILLVDYSNQLRARGQPRDAAVVEAGRVRLRPILMTAIATTVGVLPALVGLGSGAESRRPLAAAVTGGLITGTLLTLLVVPVIYTLLDDAGAVLGRAWARMRGGRTRGAPA